jgi:uncharacterized membrane protein YesL
VQISTAISPGRSGLQIALRSGQANLAVCRMSLLDLFKATIVCGGVAFLFYSFPVLGQIMAITLLTLLWLSYARKTLVRVRGRRLA